MANSYVECLIHVSQAILADYLTTCPSDRGEVERDSARLLLLSRNRGLKLFTLDFPAALKHLDSCLSSGTYTSSQIHCFGSGGKGIIPRLFKGIFLRVFESNGVLRSDVDTFAVSTLRQLLAVGKKVRLECEERRTYDVISDFYHIEDNLRRPSLDWLGNSPFETEQLRQIFIGDDDRGLSGLDPLILRRLSYRQAKFLPAGGDRQFFHQVCQSVADIVATSIGTFNPSERRPKHGPGAVSDLRPGEYKYDFPAWQDRLEDVFPQADFAHANFSLWVDAIQTCTDDRPTRISSVGSYSPNHLRQWRSWGGKYGSRLARFQGQEVRPSGLAFKSNENGLRIVVAPGRSWPNAARSRLHWTPAWRPGLSKARVPKGAGVSELIAVPKTQKGPRLIAKEPTANQWCQQIIWDHVRDRVRNSWLGEFIKFDDQTFNQEGARLASVTGNEWTVDLSSASDRLSCRLVERVFRRNPGFLNALRASRTGYLRQEIDKRHPTIVELRKFSTMGSACTFPIQSLVFLTLSLSACLFVHKLRPSERNIRRFVGRIRIYGDDIIVPAEAGHELEYLLGYLQLEVNQAKTHRTGKFRESCGLEAYDGIDVTPAYVLRVLESQRPESKPETTVSIVESSNNFFRKGWWQAADYLRTTVAGAKIEPVPIDSGIFGFVSFSGGIPSRIRWNKFLQREEFRTMVPYAKVRRKTPNTGSGLLQYFTEEPSPDLPWASGAVQKPRLKLRRGWVELPAQ